MNSDEAKRLKVLLIILLLLLGSLGPWIYRLKVIDPKLKMGHDQLSNLIPPPAELPAGPGEKELAQLRQQRDQLLKVCADADPIGKELAGKPSPDRALAQFLKRAQGQDFALTAIQGEAGGKSHVLLKGGYPELIRLLSDFPSSAPGLAATAISVTSGRGSDLQIDLQVSPVTLSLGAAL